MAWRTQLLHIRSLPAGHNLKSVALCALHRSLCRSFCFEHAVYQPTNVQKLFAAALDDGRSTLSTDDLSHWVAAAVRLA